MPVDDMPRIFAEPGTSSANEEPTNGLCLWTYVAVVPCTWFCGSQAGQSLSTIGQYRANKTYTNLLVQKEQVKVGLVTFRSSSRYKVPLCMQAQRLGQVAFVPLIPAHCRTRTAPVCSACTRHVSDPAAISLGCSSEAAHGTKPLKTVYDNAEAT